MHDLLLAWFDRHRRPLPWRLERDPYRVWISEVMSQQTRIATVVPYYRRWLERFPDVASLSQAPLDEVLKQWEGLGYYRRARALHEAAGEIVRRFGGDLPTDPATLRGLPGIGPYTAAAIASIAFGVRVVAVDANVKRIATRLFASDLRPHEVAERLGPLQPAARAGDFNEALMDLGALVCLPRHPRCPECPLAPYCRAHDVGRVDDFPAPKRRAARPQRLRYALVHLGPHGVALRRRDAKEMLPGLWGFVQSSRAPSGARLLPPVRHGYTHFDLTLIPALVTTAPAGTSAVTLDALDVLALSRVDRKVLAALPPDALPPDALPPDTAAKPGYTRTREEDPT